MPGSRGTTGELREESGFFFKMQLYNRLSVVPRHSVLFFVLHSLSPGKKINIMSCQLKKKKTKCESTKISQIDCDCQIFYSKSHYVVF